MSQRKMANQRLFIKADDINDFVTTEGRAQDRGCHRSLIMVTEISRERERGMPPL